MSEPLSFKKGTRDLVSDFFKACEFDCKCDCKNDTLIDPRLPERLDLMRKLMRKPILVTSGYRCLKKQQELREDRNHITSTGTSTHEKGIAADLFVMGVSGAQLKEFAELAGFTSIGVASTWIHVDLREGKRRWIY